MADFYLGPKVLAGSTSVPPGCSVATTKLTPRRRRALLLGHYLRSLALLSSVLFGLNAMAIKVPTIAPFLLSVR